MTTGDIVVYIGFYTNFDHLTIGKAYTTTYASEEINTIYIIADNDVEYTVSMDGFISLEEYRNLTIDGILL